jgi:hypothetical protein
MREARELIEQCRAGLRRREEAGRAGATPALLADLLRCEERIRLFDDRLLVIVDHAADEMRRRANDPTDSTRQWLSAEARPYTTHPETGRRDAARGFYGGFLAARGELGPAQNNSLDQWVSEMVVLGERKSSAPEGLDWERMENGFVDAVGYMVDRGSTDKAWHPILKKCLAGVAKNSRLAVVPGIHEHVGQLMRRTDSDAMRVQCREFLERYVIDAQILRGSDSAMADGVDLDPYFATGQEAQAAVVRDRSGILNRALEAGAPDPVSWFQNLFGLRRDMPAAIPVG